jgi:hypothetical protein
LPALDKSDEEGERLNDFVAIISLPLEIAITVSEASMRSLAFYTNRTRLMSLYPYLVHERTLLGAVDSFLHGVVHARPFFVKRYQAILEELAERWLADGGANAVDALERRWLVNFVANVDDPTSASLIIDEFFHWAVQNELSLASPLEVVPTI